MKRLNLVLILAFLSSFVWAAGASEEVGTARTEYLARRGIVTPPGEIIIDSFISSVDYHYPDPEGDLGVTVYSGHKQVSASGQDDLLVIGIQGKRVPFDDLPPLNLCVVVDRSGSMDEPDKWDWVAESLNTLAETLREKDFASLVAFGDTADVLFPSSRMSTEDRRRSFRETVDSVTPEGDSNLVAGLELGLEEIQLNISEDYTNRVLLLTDGWGETKGISSLLKKYRDRGISITTVGYGTHTDAGIMRTVAEQSGGSSRFISDLQRLEEVFGSGLARTVVPVARDIGLTLRLLGGTAVTNTWGYEHRFSGFGTSLNFSLPVLHLGDYETIVAEITIPQQRETGTFDIAVLEGTYADLQGNRIAIEPQGVRLDFSSLEEPVAGFSDARVLKAGTMLRFAQTLERIGRGGWTTPDSRMRLPFSQTTSSCWVKSSG
jgi:hypothetical protein